MKLDWIRSLEGQMAAIACLFVACIPVSGAVIFLRPKFEAAMSESYTTATGAMRDELQQLTTRLEDPVADSEELRHAIQQLSAQEKELMYQDWVTHPEPERVITVNRLAEADPEYFLRRAEQSVVCGNANQQTRGLRFLVLSEPQSALSRLQHLLRWTQQRRLPETPDKIQRAIDDWVAAHPNLSKPNAPRGSGL